MNVELVLSLWYQPSYNGVTAVGLFSFSHFHRSLKHRPLHRRSKPTIPSAGYPPLLPLPSALGLVRVDILNHAPCFRAPRFLPVWAVLIVPAAPRVRCGSGQV